MLDTKPWNKPGFYIIHSVHYDTLKLWYTNKCAILQSMYFFYYLAATFDTVAISRELTLKFN